MESWIDLLQQLAANPVLILVGVGLVAYQVAQLVIRTGNNVVATNEVQVRRDGLFNALVEQQGRDLIALRGDVSTLSSEVEQFKKRNDMLEQKNLELASKNDKLQQRVTTLEDSNEHLTQSQLALQAEVDELRRKLGLEPKYTKGETANKDGGV